MLYCPRLFSRVSYFRQKTFQRGNQLVQKKGKEERIFLNVKLAKIKTAQKDRRNFKTS